MGDHSYSLTDVFTGNSSTTANWVNTSINTSINTTPTLYTTGSIRYMETGAIEGAKRKQSPMEWLHAEVNRIVDLGTLHD